MPEGPTWQRGHLEGDKGTRIAALGCFSTGTGEGEAADCE